MTEPRSGPTDDARRQLLAAVAELFPAVITEGPDADGRPTRGVDWAALRAELGDTVLSGPEYYRLDWPGKRVARTLTHRPVTDTLRPDRTASVDFDDTGNLFIEGDNLTALKLLVRAYRGRITLAYVDPPYNTGHDFVYADDYAKPAGEYLRDSGQTDAAGGRLVANPESAGRRHSDWLSMIYPRLRLVRDLLAPDGAVMISIDDVEVANLRRLCDEIFGETNFVAQFVWTTKNAARGVPPRTMVMANHEYVVTYARNITRLRFRGLERQTTDFGNPDGDPRGLWRSESMKATGAGGNRFTITDPTTGLGYVGNWAFSPARIEEMIEAGLILFPADPSGTPRQKKFHDSYRNPRKAFVTGLGWHSTEQATKALMDLFDGEKVFDFPKPQTLLDFLIDQATEPGRGDIVLDCFAGSGSTGHAVMARNAADGGDRRFILCQLPEPVGDGAGRFATIADIARERIRRAGIRLREDTEITDLDVGFRCLTVDSANSVIPARVPGEVSQRDLAAPEDPIRSDRSPEDLLFGLMLDLGLDLSSSITEETLSGAEVFRVGDDVLLACFSAPLPESVPAQMAARRPRHAVVTDRGFVDDAGRGNADRLFGLVAPATDFRVI